MTTRTFAVIQRLVYMECRDGKRRSELTPVQRKVADTLIRQHRLVAVPLDDGDWHLESP